MNIIEYGKNNKDVLIFLHGGGLSWWNYKEIAEKLQEQYHIVIPILDGHSGSDQSFVSIEDNAKRMIDYIDKEFNGSVKFIGGTSLGGQILVEMLTQRSNICEFAFVESALVIPMALTNILIKPMMDMSFWLIKYKWFSKLQFKELKMKQDYFNDYYKDTCNIKKEDMISFLKANASYSLKEGIKDTKVKVTIFVGQKELPNMIQSAKLLNQKTPNSQLKILTNLYHGEFSLNYANEYVSEVIEWLGK